MKPDGRIKVLVVENNALNVKNLKKYLQVMENTAIVDYARTAEEALNILRNDEQDVCLIGENLPDIEGLKLLEMIRQDNPGTQVIILSEQKQVEVVLKAVRAGALDFLTYDVPYEELNSTIKRASDAASAERKKLYPYLGETKRPDRAETEQHEIGNIITVYSPKGGSGVSTITANLALALRDPNYDVALVDGDLQYGDIALLFNEISHVSMLNLAPRINDLDNKLIEDVVIHHKSSGLYILSAPPKIDLSESVTGDKFCKILDYMRQMYRYIVVNSHPILNEASLAALDSGDIIVLVMTQEITAIKAVRSFLDLWDGLKLSRNHVVLVINHFDKESPLTTRKISESLQIPVSITIPDDRPLMIKASNLGTPIVLSSKNSLIAQSIKQISDVVRKKLDETKLTNRTRLFVNPPA
jgi:pilus assembly protein CpaE